MPFFDLFCVSKLIATAHVHKRGPAFNESLDIRLSAELLLENRGRCSFSRGRKPFIMTFRIPKMLCPHT